MFDKRDDFNLHLSWIETRLLEMTDIPPIVYHHKPPIDESPKMTTITGASQLAGTIKDRINAAKAKVGAVTANADNALAKLNSAADTADEVNKAIEKEADDLMAQIGQFTNGPPA